MPFVKDDPEQQTELSSAPGGGSVGGSAPASAPRASTPNTGSGFVNLQTVLGLNQGQGAQLANGLAGDVSSAGQGVQNAIGGYGADARKIGAADFQSFDPARYGQIQQRATRVASNARALGSFGGEEAALAQKYAPGSSGGYTGGQQGMDAFLAGAEGAGQMQGAANAYGGLDQALGLAGQAYTPSSGAAIAHARPKTSGINYAPAGFSSPETSGPDVDENGNRRSRVGGKNSSPYGF